MSIARVLCVVVALGLCTLLPRSADAAGASETASISVVAVRPGAGGGNNVVIFVEGPSGIRARFGLLDTPTVFTDLLPGTYTVEVNDLGGVIDNGWEGAAKVTVGAGERLDLLITLQPVSPFPPFFGP